MRQTNAPSRRSFAERARDVLSGMVILAAIALGLNQARDAERPDVVSVHLRVDPNTAPPEVLPALPNIGPVLAGRMVEARAEQPFISLEDLQARVRGIGPKRAAALDPFLRFPHTAHWRVNPRSEPTETAMNPSGPSLRPTPPGR